MIVKCVKNINSEKKIRGISTQFDHILIKVFFEVKLILEINDSFIYLSDVNGQFIQKKMKIPPPLGKF